MSILLKNRAEIIKNYTWKENISYDEIFTETR